MEKDDENVEIFMKLYPKLITGGIIQDNSFKHVVLTAPMTSFE